MKRLYLVGIIISIILVIVSMTTLQNTQILAPAIIVLSIYLFIGCLIKLCKMNETLKGTIICMIDLLWWFP